MMHVICMMDCWYLLLVNKAVLIILELDFTIFWGNRLFLSSFQQAYKHNIMFSLFLSYDH